jgi:hypothetical protein
MGWGGIGLRSLVGIGWAGVGWGGMMRCISFFVCLVDLNSETSNRFTHVPPCVCTRRTTALTSSLFWQFWGLDIYSSITNTGFPGVRNALHLITQNDNGIRSLHFMTRVCALWCICSTRFCWRAHAYFGFVCSLGEYKCAPVLLC